jgi:hypothetical protein
MFEVGIEHCGCSSHLQYYVQDMIHHHFLLLPLGTQGANKTSPSDPISGQLLNYTPALPKQGM